MCWLLFGAAGRREILTPMLPWITVVYELPHSDFGTEAQSGCQQWADRVVEVLRSCGFLPSGELRPHRPQCLSLSAWKNLFQQLVTDPIGQGIYESRALFDLRCSAGDPSLAAELFGHVGELLRQNDVFLAVLANDSMINLPPLTLFHDLVVETDSQQHETLDLAQILLDPVADVGHVFSLARLRVEEPLA
jgi:CBS domain-containing protein